MRETIGSAFVRILADGKGLGKSFRKQLKEAEPEVEKGGKDLGRATRRGFKDGMDEDGGLGRELGNSIGKEDLARFEALQERIATAVEKSNERSIRSLRKTREETNRHRNALQLFADSFDDTGDRLGRAFGKGARNNAFNTIGGIIGFLAKLPGLVARIADFTIKGIGQFATFLGKTGELGEKASKVLTDAGEKMTGSMAKLGEEGAAAGEALAAGGPATLIAGVAAIAAALLVLPIVVGTVVSAFSLLAGAATALVASLSFAVVGALAPLAGAILPLAVGFATVALAMSAWKAESEKQTAAIKKAQSSVETYQKAVDKAVPGTKEYTKATANLAAAQRDLAAAQKASETVLSSSIGKLKTAVSGLKQTAVDSLFGNSAKESKETAAGIDAITRGINTLKPLIDAVGGAIRAVVLNLATGFGDKNGGFSQFIKEITETIPGQIEDIGAIFQDVAGIIGGLFRSLQPITGEFLGGLNKQTKEWSDKINSVAGQAGLKEFFRRAGESAQIAWDIIKQLAVDLGILLDFGKDAGDSILQSLLDTLKDLEVWLRANPTALKDWFDQSVAAAKSIGGIILAVIHLIDVLDSPENRRNAVGVFNAIIIIVKAVGVVFNGLILIGQGVVFAFKLAAKAVLLVADLLLLSVQNTVSALAAIPGPLGAPFRKIKDQIGQARQAIQNMSHSIDLIPDVMVKVQTQGVSKAVSDLAAVKRAQDQIDPTVTIGVFAKLGANPNLAGLAQGGLVVGPQRRLLGEAGPEAVVPLNRPLSQVDPAVRSLSAIAQGKAPMANGGVVSGGRNIDVGGITINTPTDDPFAVSREVINQLVGSSLI